MPRRSVLSQLEKQSLLVIPTEFLEMSRYYLLSETDISIINQKRGNHNKLGFTLLLICMRYPGIAINNDTIIPEDVVKFIAEQLKIKDYDGWRKYFNREPTRREHLLEIQNLFGFRLFNSDIQQQVLVVLMLVAKQPDKGLTIAISMLNWLQEYKIIAPSIQVIEKVCAEAITIGSQAFYAELIININDSQKQKLENLLKVKPGTKISYLHWLLQPATIPKPKHILMHIERLSFINELGLANTIGKNVHSGRLIKLAREGKNMPAGELQKFEVTRQISHLSSHNFGCKSFHH